MQLTHDRRVWIVAESIRQSVGDTYPDRVAERVVQALDYWESLNGDPITIGPVQAVQLELACTCSGCDRNKRLLSNLI